MPYNCGRGSPIPKGFTNLTCSDSRAVRAAPRGVLTELGVLLAQLWNLGGLKGLVSPCLELIGPHPPSCPGHSL